MYVVLQKVNLQRVFVEVIQFTKKTFKGCHLSSFGNVPVKKGDVRFVLKKT